MSYKKSDINIIQADSLYDGYNSLRNYTLNIKYFNGTTSPLFQRECLHRLPCVAVIPYDKSRDKIVLLEQFRVGALADASSPWLYEIVAGVNDKKGEAMADVAVRELMEESGLSPLELSFVMDYWVSPGASDEKVYLYWADVDSDKAQLYAGLHEEHEDIKVHVFALDEALDLLKSGKIANSLTIMSLQWLQLNRNNLKKK